MIKLITPFSIANLDADNRSTDDQVIPCLYAFEECK
jgi:hypothetical protein